MHLLNRLRQRPAFSLIITLLISIGLLGSVSVAAYASGGTFKLSTQSGLSSSAAHAASCGSWSVVPSPSVSALPSSLGGVTATSANDAWAVGDHVDSSDVDHTLIEHWNGTAWSIVPGAKTGNFFSFLTGVTALSTTNAWAVGYDIPSINQTLIEHWNGTNWSIIPSALSNFD